MCVGVLFDKRHYISVLANITKELFVVLFLAGLDNVHLQELTGQGELPYTVLRTDVDG